MATVNNPGIFVLLADWTDPNDTSIVGSSASNGRSVYLSVGLIRGEHRLYVGCVRRTPYTVVRANGNKKPLHRAGYASFGRASTLSHKDNGRQAIPLDFDDRPGVAEELERIRRQLQSID